MRDQPRPRVSVIVPCFNRAELLPRALHSALNQDYEPMEILVIDDGSTDRTAEVAAGLPGTRVIRHDENRGGGAARNTGIRASQGRYVAFLDSDDEWLPGKVERQIALLEDQPAVGVVYCGYYRHDDRTGQRRMGGSEPRQGNVLHDLLAGWCPETTSLFVVRREMLDVVGLYDEGLPGYQDYDLWLRLAKVCRFGVVEAPLVVKYAHSGTQVSTNAEARLEAVDRFYGKWSREMRDEIGEAGVERMRRRGLGQAHGWAVLEELRDGNRRRALYYYGLYLRNIDVKRNPRRALALAGALLVGESGYQSMRRAARRRRFLSWTKRKRETGV